MLVCLGNTRLSIQDQSAAGHQPMTEESGRYWVVKRRNLQFSRTTQTD